MTHNFNITPEMYVGFGIGSMITGLILGCMGAVKAHKKIEAKKEELGKEKLTPMETIKEAAPCFVGVVITETAGIFLICKGLGKSIDNTCAFATGMAISEASRTSFEEKAKEIIGEKKVNEIKDEVAKEQMERSAVSMPVQGVLPVIGNGSVLCHDTVTNGWFLGDHETVRQIFNDLNYRICHGEPYLTVEEYANAFNLDAPPWASFMKWDCNKRLLDPRYTTAFAPDGRPCMVIYIDPDDYLNL